MDSETARTPVDEVEAEPQKKMSAFKRVKAKARKIRDSMTNKTHSNQGHDDHNDHEEDDEDDDAVEEPEVHSVPSGGQAGIPPILHSFEKMEIQDEPKHEKDLTTLPTKTGIEDEPEHINESTTPTTTGTDDQFLPSSNSFSSKPSNILNYAQHVPDSYNDTDDHVPQDINVDEPLKQQSDYRDKTSTVSSASKIDNGGIDGNKGEENVPSAGVNASTASTAEPTTQQSSYAGMIYSATNAVASKFGYGASESPAGVGTGSVVNKGEDDVKTVEVGSDINVAQKTKGTSPDTDIDTADMDSQGTGKNAKEGGSMYGYIAEKLKPGEDDKALSEVITDTLHKPTAEEVKEEEEDKNINIGAVVSDAFHKRNDDDDDLEKSDKPMGLVTESDEVASSLGSSEEEKSGKGLVNESPDVGMVGKVKGWFGYGGETSPSQVVDDHKPSHEDTIKKDQDVSREGTEDVSYERGKKHNESSI